MLVIIRVLAKIQKGLLKTNLPLVEEYFVLGVMNQVNYVIRVVVMYYGSRFRSGAVCLAC